MPDQRKILVVEDEDDIAELVALNLRDQNYEVSIARNGHEGRLQAFARHWDLIVLDLRLPGQDGLSLCRELRAEQNYVPILMLTSKSSELDRVIGLETGADDYLTKPFGVSELLARVRAIFRRVDAISGQAKAESETIRVGELCINEAERQVFVGERAVDLTPREFDMLLHFARNPGRVFSRSQLLDKVWGYGHKGYEHTVNSHINRLRSKIETDSNKPRYIVTVWGVGYKLEAKQAAA
jgi:DNA-binding response OmpR family regulator